MQQKPDSSLAGKDLRGLDLRFQDLSNHVLFATDLRGAKLYGAKVSMLCQQFDGVKLDDSQVAYVLMMLSQADINPSYTAGIHRLIEDVHGPVALRALKRVMSLI